MPMSRRRSACNGWARPPRCRRPRKWRQLSDPTTRKTMAKIERGEILQVYLVPKTVRTDAIQSFATQETPMVRIHTSDGIVGTGYSYTIGTGGSSVIGLAIHHLAARAHGR